MAKIIVMLVWAFGINAHASTLRDAHTVNCSSPTGSYFRVDILEQSLTAKFAHLPEMTNNSDEGLMPVEFQSENGATSLLSLVVDKGATLFGSEALFAPSNMELGNNSALTAVFRDMNGRVETELLSCAIN